MSHAPVRLWSDEPSPVDLLAFGAVAETAVEAVLDDTLDPIALGVSGPWGSGKSTVLQLIETQLADRSAREPNQRILVVRSDPWRYDPAVGAKATLISEVLAGCCTIDGSTPMSGSKRFPKTEPGAIGGDQSGLWPPPG